MGSTLATRELDKAELMAFNEAMLRSTVGIAVNENTKIGTGTLVSYNGSKFILTAEHVIKNCDLVKAKFFVPPPTPLKEAAMRDGIPAGFALPYAGEHFSIGTPIIDVTNDIAAIPLISTALVPDYMRFFPVEECISEISEGASVLILGFPTDNAAAYLDHEFSGGKRWQALGITNEHGYYSLALQKKYALPGFNNSRQFLMEYSRTDEGIRPYGFSGAAAWCSDAPMGSGGSIWQPKPVLVGTFTSWYPKGTWRPHLVRATKGKIVKALFGIQEIS